MSKITDQDEIQFRQINPSWIDGDVPSSQAFMPTKKDEGLLSLDRSATTTARASYDDFRALGLRSEAVFGLTPSEFEAEPNAVQCFESPLENNPHHSHADFNGLSNSQKKAKSKALKRHAIARGKFYP